MTPLNVRPTNRLQRLYRCLAVVLGLLLAASLTQHLAAQTFTASIAGTVTDSSGAVISGAELQLTNLATKDVRVQKTDDQGSYSFTNLLPGTYRISAKAAGFDELVRTGMILRASTAATIDLSLRVGSTTQQVVVSSSAVLLDTQSATNSVTMDSRLLQALPQNTLQPLNFVYDLAGTTEAQGGMSTRSGSFDQNTSTFGINGGRSGESEILIDGAPSTAIDWGGLMVSPIQDSVQEQQVIDNVYDAQYERGGEGVVTLITRGGSPQFHGEFYDFMRNSSFDANTWSNNLNGAPIGKFHRNQFGANIGGPIAAKHNVFFFAAYEGLRQPETDASGLMARHAATHCQRWAPL